MAFSEKKLIKRCEEVQQDLMAKLSPNDRKKLIANLIAAMPKGKLKKKDALLATALGCAIKVLGVPGPVSHIEMLTIYGDTFGKLFEKPKGMDRHQHNLMTYITLLVA